MSSAQPPRRKVLSVSQLTLSIKGTLERDFTSVWVGGEISDLSRPHSGHIYLTLKDEGSQIRGVVWRSVAERLDFDLSDGLQVVCRGDVDVYPPRGSYQLVIRYLEPMGLGALQLAFKRLFERLSAEGLFDPSLKKPLPRFPRRIAFVTSPTGAAIRDFLEVVRRRWQGVEVLVIPARVQGEGAADEIAAGIRLANKLADPPDVLVVGRGGGSMEDLWCFNEEVVVRAIVASRIPVVSAVGHEIDVTLADLAADVRAATPTEAAERVVPSGDEVATTLASFRERLLSSLRRQAEQARAHVDALAQRRVLRRPFDTIELLSRRVDELELRAQRAIRRQLARDRDQLAAAATHLEGLSPLAVLGRGYSCTYNSATGELIRTPGDVSPGDEITTRLASGRIISRVESTEAENTSSSS